MCAQLMFMNVCVACRQKKLTPEATSEFQKIRAEEYARRSMMSQTEEANMLCACKTEAHDHKRQKKSLRLRKQVRGW